MVIVGYYRGALNQKSANLNPRPNSVIGFHTLSGPQCKCLYEEHDIVPTSLIITNKNISLLGYAVGSDEQSLDINIVPNCIYTLQK